MFLRSENFNRLNCTYGTIGQSQKIKFNRFQAFFLFHLFCTIDHGRIYHNIRSTMRQRYALTAGVRAFPVDACFLWELALAWWKKYVWLGNKSSKERVLCITIDYLIGTSSTIPIVVPVSVHQERLFCKINFHTYDIISIYIHMGGIYFLLAEIPDFQTESTLLFLSNTPNLILHIHSNWYIHVISKPRSGSFVTWQ